MDWFGIISLLVVGLILVGVELFFIPGTTFVGIIGAIFLIAGIYITYQIKGTITGNVVLISQILLIVVLTIVGFKNKTWKLFSNENQITSKIEAIKSFEISIGSTGKTISVLKPYGKADFNNKFYEVCSEGDMIPPGTEIIILKIEGNKILVTQNSINT